MNDELYDVRVEMETYSRIISETIAEQETWWDMVWGATELCIKLELEPAWSEKPHLRELLLTTVCCVLDRTKGFFDDSDHAGELALVKGTKSDLEYVISAVQDQVDKCYPEGEAR